MQIALSNYNPCMHFSYYLFIYLLLNLQLMQEMEDKNETVVENEEEPNSETEKEVSPNQTPTKNPIDKVAASEAPAEVARSAKIESPNSPISPTARQGKEFRSPTSQSEDESLEEKETDSESDEEIEVYDATPKRRREEYTDTEDDSQSAMPDSNNGDEFMSPAGEQHVEKLDDSEEEGSPAAKRSAHHLDDSSVEFVEQSAQPSNSPSKRLKVNDENGEEEEEEEGDYIDL